MFLINSVTPRACAQAIRKADEPVGAMRFIASGSRQQGHGDGAAGLEAVSGIMSVVALKPYTADSRMQA